jgi:predicted Rossmann-fold nucleotide-binding protein
MVRRSRTVEVETLAEFDALVDRGGSSMRHWRVQSVDLSGREPELLRHDPRGALFLGCNLSDTAADHVRRGGGLVFPDVPEVPFDAYRSSLYTPEELYDGLAGGYECTLDARIYAWAQQRLDLAGTLGQALHDHAVDDALGEHVAGRRLAGIMGGHALARGSDEYVEAALLGRQLARSGLTVASGGGPGAMEAANLGAYLSPFPDDALAEAVDLLATRPTFRPDVRTWAEAALEVRRRWPEGADSLGIPTWFYGHEPPNLLASSVAKYFKNAIREDVLLHLCTAGIAFLPGRAGTVQEIFQDACENYYAAEGDLAPMVLVGREHWTRELPAWPLLESLAAGRAMADAVHLVGSPDEAASLLIG